MVASVCDTLATVQLGVSAMMPEDRAPEFIARPTEKKKEQITHTMREIWAENWPTSLHVEASNATEFCLCQCRGLNAHPLDLLIRCLPSPVSWCRRPHRCSNESMSILGERDDTALFGASRWVQRGTQVTRTLTFSDKIARKSLVHCASVQEGTNKSAHRSLDGFCF